VNPLVSVLVPTYQDAQLLELALPVLAGLGEAAEVFVMNNDPAQDAQAVVASCFQAAQVIEMGLDTGFGRAINVGIQRSRGEFVLILNADVILAPSYVTEMLNFFSRHPRAGCAGGKLYRYDLERRIRTNLIDTAGVRLGRNRRPMARGEGQPDDGALDQEEEVFGVDSAGLFARRSALESIRIGEEYLDSSFFLHKEDTDLCWRLRLAGWEIWYVPTATGAHGRTTRGLGERSYVSAMGEYHRRAVERPALVQIHAMKNQWLMMTKNEDLSNFLRDSPYILAREATVLAHNLIFAPRSLVAVREFVRLWTSARKKRRIIKRRQVSSPSQMRLWLGGGRDT
jgi:GT2 family glycosyltransferase